MYNPMEDLRFAARILRKNPGFTAIAVLTLALGIGANTTVFSVVNGVLLQPLPYSDPERLVEIRETSRDGQPISVAYLNYRDWRRQNHTCEALAAFRDNNFNLTGAGEPERLHGELVSAAFFPLLGVQPVAGRTFLDEEDRPGGPPVALLSEVLWRTHFGGSTDILGRQLTLNDTAYTVIGVVPASFQFPGPRDVYTPLAQWRSPMLNDRKFHPGLRVIARRKPGVSEEQTRAEFEQLGATLAAAYPQTNANHSAAVVPLKESIVGKTGPTLAVLLGAVAFVLLIACANIANLLLARSSVRQSEIGVRIALGADRGRIVRQLLTESVLLSLAGGAAGCALAAWTTRLVVRAVPQGLPRMNEIAVDARVLVFTLAVSLLTGIFFGLIPALELSHSRLIETARGSTTGRGRLRDALVLAEIAVAVVLLAGGVLMIRSIWNLYQVNPGFDPHNVLTLQVGVSSGKGSASSIRAAYSQLLERVGQIPGIQAAALTLDLPLSGDAEVPISVEGSAPPASQSDLPSAIWYATSRDYLRVMKIPLLRGRFFDERDLHGPAVLVIDEVLARSLFPGQDAVGKRLLIGGPNNPPSEIVGIVGHVKHWGLDGDATAKVRAQFYTSFESIPDSFLSFASGWNTLVLRTRGNPLHIVDAVRAQVIGGNRDQPVYNVRSMDQIVAETLAERRFAMLLLGTFAAIALLLAAIGVYGVISYAVNQRTREIGIRMALGARPGDVLKLVVGRGAMLALAGVAAGIAVSALVTRSMSKLLFGVSPTDPLAFAAVAVILSGVAILASYLPAQRAAKVDPLTALRYE